METTQGHLSAQARRRLQAGELILRGFHNDEIVEIMEVSLSSVKRWQALSQLRTNPEYRNLSDTIGVLVNSVEFGSLFPL